MARFAFTLATTSVVAVAAAATFWVSSKGASAAPTGLKSSHELAAIPVRQDTGGFTVVYQNGPLGDFAPKGVPVWVSSTARVGTGFVKVNVLLLDTQPDAPRLVQIVSAYPSTLDGGVGLGDGSLVATLAKPESLATPLTTVVENGTGKGCQVFAAPATGNWLQVSKASDILVTTTPLVKGSTDKPK
jgi:hypothetical protein